jgi:hypothetical protein
MRFLEARNAEKCTIRPSYSASVRTREANEPCSAGARGEGLLGLADRRPGDLGLAEDGLLQDRAATPDVSAKPAQHLDAAFIRLTSQQMRRKHTFALKCPAHLLRPQPARGRVDREGETPQPCCFRSPQAGVPSSAAGGHTRGSRALRARRHECVPPSSDRRVEDIRGSFTPDAPRSRPSRHRLRICAWGLDPGEDDG